MHNYVWLGSLVIVALRLLILPATGKQRLWPLQGLGQGFVSCWHLNLAIWILIWLMTMFIWVFVSIGMAHSLKQKELLHDKASKAMYSRIQKGRRLKLPTDINCLTVVWHPFYCMDVKCGVMKIPISLKKYIHNSVNSSLVYHNFLIICQYMESYQSL